MKEEHDESHHHDHHHAHDHDHDHGHGHGHGYNGRSLRLNDIIFEDIYRQVVAWLKIPQGTTALDAGSGAGGFSAALARAVGNDGSVTALDSSVDLLEFAQSHLRASPYASRVFFKQGDVNQLPFSDGSFDLVWSSHTIHHMKDQVEAIRQLVRVLRPAGRLAIREGVRDGRFLPDDIGICPPGLHDRINVAFNRWFYTNVRGGDALKYPFGWLRALADAGLQNVTARTFVLEGQPPFSEAQSRYMERQLKRWVEDGDRRALLEHSDARAMETLLDHHSEHYIRNRDDLHLVQLVTVYTGTTSAI